MTSKRVAIIWITLMAVICLGGCASNKVIKIEESNAFIWQKYMNEEEFEQLEQGMSYMEVVEIAHGGGEQLDDNTFIWLDERLMTQGYEVSFEDEQLVKKRRIEKRGYSIRDLVE